jgi:hypothetical protein
MFIKHPKVELSDSDKIYIHPNIIIKTDCDDYNKVEAKKDIKKGTIIIKEYPTINLFGQNVFDRDVEFIKKLIQHEESQLFPRSYSQFKRTKMTKYILSKIDQINNTSIKNFFDKFDKDTIEFYYCKHLFNSFEGNEYGPLYLPLIAKLNHSCNPNTMFTLNKDTGQMILLATRDIKKNEEITDSYLSNKNIISHQSYLQDHYGFQCGCK